MKRKNWILTLGACAAFGTAAAGYAYGTELGLFDKDRSDLTLQSASAFQAFALYAPGQAFENSPLTHVGRRLAPRLPKEPLRANYVSFKYGSCEAALDAPCAAPLEIQIWPACERARADYTLVPDLDGPGPMKARPLPRTDVQLRGVPGAFYEDSHRLELYTGRVTVVIFGSTAAQLRDAARMLRGVNVRAVPQSSLPRPVKGALQGRLRCTPDELKTGVAGPAPSDRKAN